jgi:hypothetical protein
MGQLILKRAPIDDNLEDSPGNIIALAKAGERDADRLLRPGEAARAGWTYKFQSSFGFRDCARVRTATLTDSLSSPRSVTTAIVCSLPPARQHRVFSSGMMEPRST